jgi:hypothetical protein
LTVAVTFGAAAEVAGWVCDDCDDCVDVPVLFDEQPAVTKEVTMSGSVKVVTKANRFTSVPPEIDGAAPFGTSKHSGSIANHDLANFLWGRCG